MVLNTPGRGATPAAPTLPGHPPKAPFLGQTRLRSIRQLSAAECELLEYDGHLGLARREYRFLFGPWRPSKYYVVSHRRHGVVMVCTREQLVERGVTID